ncbi:MAG: iron ABC transporter permease [Oscillospiraceae bacterium]|nr:iron ABC transporter permease [Oscillospiraceae bacterium]
MKAQPNKVTKSPAARPVICALSVFVCLIVLYICIRFGSIDTSVKEITDIIVYKIFGGKVPDTDPNRISIIWNIRIPRVFAAFLSGAALSASGVVMQSVLQNPLASSYTLGVSSGASLGVTAVMILGSFVPVPGRVLMPLSGFVFGFAAVILAIALSGLVSGSSRNYAIILTGMVLSLFLNAVLTFIASFDIKYSARIQLWQMGSFGGSTFENVLILFAVDAACLILLLIHSDELDIMTFGEEQSAAMGVDNPRSRLLFLLTVAVMTGVSVCFSGIIGFVDLIAPHVVRRIFGSSHRAVLPLSMLYGGTFMALSDLISRALFSPREISVGAVTAMIGVPFFAYIFFGRKKL